MQLGLIFPELLSASRGVLVRPEGKETVQIVEVMLLEEASIANKGGKTLHREGAAREAHENNFVFSFPKVPVVGEKAVRVSDFGRDA